LTRADGLGDVGSFENTELHFGQARHDATGGAGEVGMGLGRLVVIFASHFEAPNVVAMIVPSQQTSFGKGGEVAKDRGLIDARVREPVGEFGM